MNHSIDWYVETFSDIAMDISDMSDSHLCDAFLKGLRDQTRIQVVLSRPALLADAISSAEMVDRVIFEPQYLDILKPKNQTPRSNPSTGIYNKDGVEDMH